MTEAINARSGQSFFICPHLVQVHLQRSVGDQLDIIKANDATIIAVPDRITRAVYVNDRRVLTQCLPYNATPTGLERAIDVIAPYPLVAPMPARTDWVT